VRTLSLMRGTLPWEVRNKLSRRRPLVPVLVGFFAGLNGTRPRTSSDNDRRIARVILKSWMMCGASFINLQTQEVADADHRREAIGSPKASRGTPCQL
jgi:hypothetical protein